MRSGLLRCVCVLLSPAAAYLAARAELAAGFAAGVAATRQRSDAAEATTGPATVVRPRAVDVSACNSAAHR